MGHSIVMQQVQSFLQVGQGAGYVYMHQGCCEHLVELSDVRSIHHAELLQSQPTLYPLVLKEVRFIQCCMQD